MSIRTYQIGSSRKRGDGLRIGAVRFLPRGVKKQDYARLHLFDVWLPVLAPSRALLRWAKGREWNARSIKTFFARYAREMEASTDSWQVIRLVAQASLRTPISVGCYCADETRCHRSVLLKLIRKAQKAR
ncbi:MAG: hypothetical protein A2W68_09255 [Betaproteobacteria bacterium RIFCSPLOWO2_02_64_14]|nr:MAG: hypothetical protein A2W68_09255 [Betaproteobacteria bacterium RIFCSPLOWO2_02_64_14]